MDLGRTRLHEAVINGNTAKVDTLIVEGVEIDTVDNSRLTPLHWAARKGFEGIVSTLLMKGGADIKTVDKDGKTALHYAAQHGQVAAVQRLIEVGADVRAVDKDGKTALNYAALSGNGKTVRKLIDLGADVNAVDKDGKTVLHHAAQHGRDITTQKLIEVGADVKTVDKDGKTALHYAAQHGQAAAVQKFVELGSVDLGWLALLENEGDEAAKIVSLVHQAMVRSGPWIRPHNSDIQLPKDKIDVNLHQSCCAHKLRQKDARESKDGPGSDSLKEHFSLHEMQRRVSLFCGLAGVFPPGGWSSSDFGRVSFSAEMASIIFNDEVDTSEPFIKSPTKLISQLHEAARGLTFAAVSLQQTGFCCNQFTVLTASEQGSSPENISVVRMNTIPFHLLVRLTQEIATLRHEGLNDSALSRSVSASTNIMERLFEIALSPPSTTEQKLHLCSLTVQLLCLGLVFYAQAHTGELHPIYVAEPLNKVVARGSSLDHPYIIAERCGLACMGEMVGGKVFVFRMSSQTLSAGAGKFYLSATCEEIVDSWGPGSLILDPAAPSEEKIFGLVIRGGVVKPERTFNNGYRLFHWEVEFSKNDPSPPDAFSYRDRIVVGATASTDPPVLAMIKDNCREHPDRPEARARFDPLDAGQELAEREVNAARDEKWTEQVQAQQHGQQQAREPAQDQELHAQAGAQPQPQQAPEPLETHVSVTINNACPRNIAASYGVSQPLFSELGTEPSCWKFVERNVVTQVGDKVLGQVGGVQVKQPGIPRKRALLDRWTNEGKLSLFEEPWGLQVSLCTGVARRVPLRVLVRDDLMDYVNSLQIDGWQPLEAEARENMASKNVFAAWAEQLSLEQRGCMRDVFDKLLKRLKDTGFDRNGREISILWPYGSDANFCVKIPPEKDQKWLRMLKDKEWSATFAVATNQCLETPSHKYRGETAVQWDGAKVLSTFMCPSNSGAVPSTIKNHPGTAWQVEHDEWYWYGEVGGKVQSLARKVPNAITELEFRRSTLDVLKKFLSWLPPHYVLVERPDVKFRGEEVLVVCRS